MKFIYSIFLSRMLISILVSYILNRIRGRNLPRTWLSFNTRRVSLFQFLWQILLSYPIVIFVFAKIVRRVDSFKSIKRRWRLSPIDRRNTIRWDVTKWTKNWSDERTNFLFLLIINFKLCLWRISFEMFA